MRVISESCRRIEIEGANGEMVAAVEKIRVIEYETFDALAMYCVDTLEQLVESVATNSESTIEVKPLIGKLKALAKGEVAPAPR